MATNTISHQQKVDSAELGTDEIPELINHDTGEKSETNIEHYIRYNDELETIPEESDEDLPVTVQGNGDEVDVMPTRMEEASRVALDIQCLWRGGRAALTSTTNKFLHREVMVVHGLLRLEQAKQIRQMIPLPLKQTQTIEKACFLINYSPKQEPNKSSSLRTRCHKVLRAMTCPQLA